MKTLYLVRHAKSSWENVSLPDFERPLNKRGNVDKIEMSKRLAKEKLKVDLIISSSAKRTKQTSIALAKEIGYSTSEIHFVDELYHASLQELITQLNSIDSCYNSVMIVGHNPGISVFCDYLCEYLVDFPTLGIACINFEIDSWEKISRHLGFLKWFDYPKKQEG